MNTINLAQPFLNLDGTEVPDTNMAKFLGERLANSRQANPIKVFDWSTRLFKEGEIQVDDEDLGLLLGIIRANEGLNLSVAAQAQLLKKINADVAPKAPNPS